jgi:transposase InsO family protein
MEAKSSQKWTIPYSARTSISKSSIWRWIRAYKNSDNDIKSLFPQIRGDKGSQRALDDETSAVLLVLKQKFPSLTVPRLIDKVYAENLVAGDKYLSESSVYRLLHLHGLMKESQAKVDRRRFEAEAPNDLWQSDVMHGPTVTENGKQKKTYLIAFIDDHSRLIPHGEFYFSENTVCFLSAFRSAISTRGIPKKLYVDNGSAFRSKHLDWVCASLGIALIHAKPYQPQGKGKIERFFRTVRSDMLSLHHPVDLISLNTGFGIWLNDTYLTRKHSSTGQTPFKRFAKGLDHIKHAPSDLSLHFRTKARRKVTSDRVVQLNNLFFEAPTPLIKKQVELLYLPEKPEEVELFYKKKSYGILPILDRHVNAKVGRDAPSFNEDIVTQKEEISAMEQNIINQNALGQLSFS